MKKDRNLSILILVSVINAIGFGIIVPLIYPYSKLFGITTETMGLLTASFSIAQFFAAPILGALSDKYGRKPVLIISLIGTFLSFILFARAQSLVMLFAARIFDGITGGNMSIAQAIISDSTTPEERVKSFGVLGAAFGSGFLIGPAIGGILSEVNIHAPFYFAAGLAFIGTACALFFLKETNNNPNSTKSSGKGALSLGHLISGLKKPIVGTAVFIGFLLTMSQFTMIIGFQTFNVDVLKLSPLNIGLFFAGLGLTSVFTQLVGLRIMLKYFTSKPKILLISLSVTFTALFFAGFTNTFIPFAICLLFHGLFNMLKDPMLNSIISENTDQSEQGAILGINQSYASIGQMLGPIFGGLVAAVSIHYTFFLAAALIFIAFLFTLLLKHKEQVLK